MKKTFFQNTKERFSLIHSGSIAISNRRYRLIALLLFGWYLFQVLYFALSIRPGISPDEIFHIELSALYADSKTIRLPDTPETYKYGAISTQAYLYHFAMGKLLLLNVFDFNEVLYLRLINIALSLITLWLVLLLIREITSNRLMHFAVLMLATNMLMFVFLSAMVSYDNMTNLFAAASFLYLVRFLKNHQVTDLLILMLILGIGSLAKYAILPLVAIHFLVVLYVLIKGKIKKQCFLMGSFSIREIVLIVAVVILLIPNYNLYGRNYLEYKSLKPSPGNVIGHKNAMQHSALFRSYNQMRKNADKQERYSFENFAIRYYFRTVETIFGVSGHLSLTRPAIDQLFHQILLLTMIIAAMINYRHLPKKEILIILLLASIAYFLIAFSKNYETYTKLGVFGAGLHGRYNFPVLAPILVFLTFSSFYRMTDFIKLMALFVGAPLLAWQSFFWFLARVNEEWFWF